MPIIPYLKDFFLEEVQFMDNFSIDSREEVRKFIKLVLSIGTLLLKSGAEIYRVEDTMNRVCNSRSNISNADSFVTNTGIFITLEYDGEVFTRIKRVRDISIDLNKINLLNDFSRKFVNQNISIDEGLETIKQIQNTKSYSIPLKIFAGGILSGFFSQMYGGNMYDFIASFIAALLTLFILDRLSKYKLTFFIDTFIGAFLASFFSCLLFAFNIGHSLDMIIIGAIMCLVPGVSITNSIRDTMSGDSLAGLSKGMEAIFSALAIAFGVGIVLNLYMKGVI